jgi:hypothetical protein
MATLLSRSHWRHKTGAVFQRAVSGLKTARTGLRLKVTKALASHIYLRIQNRKVAGSIPDEVIFKFT